MKKSQTEPTTRENLEEKFQRGEEVLDYFNVQKANVIKPSKRAGSSSVRRESASTIAVKEDSARYRKVSKENPR
ncbi:MAG: hypothetical protein DLM73_02825 [Chthoniobacterales bacterium]|nr:MAG: hypothetical protein DLM73_02825 [Chthoniobacterales bacterium]